MSDTVRIGIVGLGANTRARHVPGFAGCEQVAIHAVCNRTPESTRRVAAEFSIPHCYDQWDKLVTSPEIDAVMIGTWPYLHAPITLAALSAGKHVLTEARMASSLAEAEQMAAAAAAAPELVAQIVPSPFGLRGDRLIRKMIAEGFLGELREVVVLGVNDAVSDPRLPRHWRQVRDYSGINMLTLGILQETLNRWLPDPLRVFARTTTFTTERWDDQQNAAARVETPDSLQVLADFPGGAVGVYHLSGAVHHGPGMQIHLYGTDGTIKYAFTPEDRILAGRRGDAELAEVPVPVELEGGWRVEEEFISAIRGGPRSQTTDFPAGLRYMRLTDAVHRSALRNAPMELPR